MAKKKQPVTPVAPCLYPFLDKPDTRWKEDGEYKVVLVFDQDDKFIAKLEKKALKEYKEKKASMKPAKAKALEYVSPVKQEVDEDNNETGNVRVSFKSNAIYKDKKTGKYHDRKLKMFDSKGTAIVVPNNIGNGSKVAVSFNPVGTVVKGVFYLSLWMNAVQLSEIVEYNPDGSSYGFDEFEDGYEGTDDDGGAVFTTSEADAHGKTDDDDDDDTDF